jgi:hypothetical protein
MPVCIAGMHRSGTSMVAKLLADSGVHLGAPDEMLPASPENAEGYYEHADIVRINDEVLAALGGAWDVPPRVETGWEADPKFEPLRDKAREAVARLAAHERWGWKDPRNSLTLPFWRSVVGELRVVHCVRHPFEVAESLTRRGASSPRFGHDLWVEHNRRLLADTEPGERIVTHYASYFRDAPRELARVREFLGLGAALGDAAPSEALRHNEAPGLANEALPDDVLRCYAALCAEAGPVFAETLADEPELRLPAADGALAHLLRAQLPAKSALIDELRLALRREQKRARRLEERLDALERSRIFRYSAPLRATVSALRRGHD